MNRPAEFHVYFMRQEGTGFIKIGRARDPYQRHGNVQVGSPYPIRIVNTVVEHPHFTEARLHYLFDKYHFRGEWFKEVGELAVFVRWHLPWFAKESRNRRLGKLKSEAEWRWRCSQLYVGNFGGDEIAQ